MSIILQINVVSNWGSTGRIVEQIGQVAIANGWESYIAYGRYPRPSQSNQIRISSKKEQLWHLIQTRLFDRHGLASRDETKKLITKIENIQPDIIHLHNIHGYFLNYRILFNYLAKKNIPIVWTLHDCWSFTGHCTHYSASKCYRWKTLCYNCPQKGEYPTSLFRDRSKQNHKDKIAAFSSVKGMTLVTVSDWLAQEVKQSFFSKYPIKKIYNGVDMNVFSPTHTKKSDLGIIDTKFLILGVASVWSYRKGLYDFILLRKRLPEDYVIVLIGLNKGQIGTLPKGIIGLQRTNNVQELTNYYSAADIYVNASVEETLGLTTVESLSCGTPAMVYNSTACPEVVSDETGFVVEPHDIEGMIEILQNLKEKKITIDSQKCRERVSHVFNEKKQYLKYIQLYNEILNSN